MDEGIDRELLELIDSINRITVEELKNLIDSDEVGVIPRELRASID